MHHVRFVHKINKNADSISDIRSNDHLVDQLR